MFVVAVSGISLTVLSDIVFYRELSQKRLTKVAS
jgi:hypothetical protein